VHVCVWYGDGNEAWGDEEAENAMDDLDGEIASAILTIEQAHTGGLRTVRNAGGSDANETLQVGGNLYLHEVIPLEVKA